jgi:hypothetical protein
MREFHHVGIPTDDQQPGEVYVSATKVWVTDPNDHPYRVEYLRFEPDSPVTGPVRNLPHFAYKVDDLNAAMAGKKVLLGPFTPMDGLEVVFIQEDGAVIEFMEWSK